MLRFYDYQYLETKANKYLRYGTHVPIEKTY